MRANWIAGVPKAEQKAKVEALIRLGLTPQTAAAVAPVARVNAEALSVAVAKLERGEPLTEADLNVIGRMNAVVEALMDAAFEAADQQYRNSCRLLAGLSAIGLAVGAWLLWPAATANARPSFWTAFAVGLLAVPIAPVAKDLTSALSAAMQALKSVRRA
jgi:hypothetical protein